MIKKYTLILSLCLSASYAIAPSLAIVDPHFSPYSGGENLLTAHRILEKTEEALARSWGYPNKPRKTWGARGERFLELVLVWDPINHIAMVVQHEVFGHGYRIRSLGSSYAQVQGYDFSWPPPYGNGEGATAYRADLRRLTSLQEMSIASAGVEATAILAHLTKMKWLQNSAVDARQATLYLSSQQNLTLYTLSASHFLESERDGNDITTYLFWLNKTYAHAYLSKQTLEKKVLLNLLDPFTYYSLYGWLRFVFAGKNTHIPMIPISSIGYLPGMRVGLTPFGPEYYFENFFAKNQNAKYAYIRYGNYAKNDYWGFGVELPALYQRRQGSIGLRFDFWRQPKPLFEDPRLALDKPLPNLKADQDMKQKHYGIALSAICFYNFYYWDTTPLALYAELGYKTTGFLPGNSLSNAPIARVGLSSSF